jgi:hypothetical protein
LFVSTPTLLTTTVAHNSHLAMHNSDCDREQQQTRNCHTYVLIMVHQLALTLSCSTAFPGGEQSQRKASHEVYKTTTATTTTTTAATTTITTITTTI